MRKGDIRWLRNHVELMIHRRGYDRTAVAYDEARRRYLGVPKLTALLAENAAGRDQRAG